VADKGRGLRRLRRGLSGSVGDEGDVDADVDVDDEVAVAIFDF
jgi:hypothetical protein